jgi:hypothetical protein
MERFYTLPCFLEEFRVGEALEGSRSKNIRVLLPGIETLLDGYEKFITTYNDLLGCSRVQPSPLT